VSASVNTTFSNSRICRRNCASMLKKLRNGGRACASPPSPLLTGNSLGSRGGYAIFLFHTARDTSVLARALCTLYAGERSPLAIV